MNAKALPSFLIGTILCGSIFFSCGKSKNSSSCTATPTVTTASAKGTVTYSASATGSYAKLTSVKYQDASGMVTVNNPGSPWQVSVSVVSGASINISATGTGGNIKAGFSYLDSAGIDPIVTSSECND